jgi:hypothetical protein
MKVITTKAVKSYEEIIEIMGKDAVWRDCAGGDAYPEASAGMVALIYGLKVSKVRADANRAFKRADKAYREKHNAYIKALTVLSAIKHV